MPRGTKTSQRNEAPVSTPTASSKILYTPYAIRHMHEKIGGTIFSKVMADKRIEDIQVVHADGMVRFYFRNLPTLWFIFDPRIGLISVWKPKPE